MLADSHISSLGYPSGDKGRVSQSVVSKHSILFPLVSYISSSKLMQWASISIKGNVKPRANRRNIFGQQLPTLLDVTASVCTPVACCLKGCCAKFETGQAFSYVQRDATTPNIVGPTMFGVVASVYQRLQT